MRVPRVVRPCEPLRHAGRLDPVGVAHEAIDTAHGREQEHGRASRIEGLADQLPVHPVRTDAGCPRRRQHVARGRGLLGRVDGGRAGHGLRPLVGEAPGVGRRQLDLLCRPEQVATDGVVDVPCSPVRPDVAASCSTARWADAAKGATIR